MSRTKRGGKGPGFEYWSRRGYPSVRMSAPGKSSKIATHRVERREGKKATQQETWIEGQLVW